MRCFVLQTSTDRVFSRVGDVNRALRCPHARRQISSKFHRTVYARTQRRHWPPARAIYSQNFVVVVVVVVHSQTRCRRRRRWGRVGSSTPADLHGVHRSVRRTALSSSARSLALITAVGRFVWRCCSLRCDDSEWCGPPGGTNVSLSNTSVILDYRA